MTTSPRLVLATACCSALLGLSTAAHADRVIDAFTDALPPTTLPGTSTPAALLWAGQLSGVTQVEQSASQSNLPHVIGGQRTTRVREATLTNFVTGTIGGASASYSTGVGPSGVLSLEYGALNSLNLDLVTDGSLAFEVDIVGDMDDGATPRPIQLTISARTGTGALVARTFSLAHDGVYQFPFSAFPGVSFADVDYLRFTFDASQVASVDYTLIGGLRTTGCLQTGTILPDVFLDTFRTGFPPRALPGAGTVPVMWAGTDGSTVKPSDLAVQSGIAGAIGGQRNTTVLASAIQNFITASMTSVGVTPALAYSTGTGTSGELTLEYGAQSSLHANLAAMKAFELEINGDLASGGTPRPVPLTVTVISGTGSASAQLTLLGNGTYYLPFTAFPGVSFADVDDVQFHFDASAVNAVDYTLIGGLRASACIR